MSAAAQPSDPGAAHRAGAFPAFDGLRAVAALSVLVHHASFPTGRMVVGWGRPDSAVVRFLVGDPAYSGFLARADVGVTIFFVISGFLLYRPFVQAGLDGAPVGDVARYFLRRAARIFPAYWVAFVAIANLPFFGFQSGAVHGGRNWIERITLTHIYFDFDRAVSAMSQAWTLSVEVSFYLFLPLWAMLVRRWCRSRDATGRIRVELIGLGGLAAVAVAWRLLCFSGVSEHLKGLGVYWLPANLDWFAIGMALAVVSAASSGGHGLGRVADRLGRGAWRWWAVSLVAFWLVSTKMGLPGYFEPTTWRQKMLIHGFYAVVAGALLVPAVFGAQDRSLLHRTLRFGPVAYLGVVSYGIYLWHQAVIWHFTRDRPLFSADFGSTVVVTVLVSAAIATVSWFVIEQPLQRASRGKSLVAPRAAVERGHITGIDGLRAIAALSIVVLHVTSGTGATLATPMGAAFARLDVGVTVFFVISGFVLYRPFVARHLEGGVSTGLGRYAHRRALRIYPAYWVALGAAIVVFGQTELFGVADHLRHLFLVQIYQPAYGLGGIIPAWTLAVEVSFYAFLPLYACVVGVLARRRTRAGVLNLEYAGVAVLIAVAFAVRLWLATTRGTDAVSLRWLPANLDWFALGIGLAVAQVGGLPARVRAAVRPAGLWWAGAVVAFAAVSLIGLPRTGTSGTVAQDLARQWLYAAVAVGIVTPFAWGDPDDGGAIRGLVRSRPLQALGVISYGIFLWHFDVAEWLMRHWVADLGGFRTPVLLGTTLVVTAALAAVSWFTIERPLLRPGPPGPPGLPEGPGRRGSVPRRGVPAAPGAQP